MKALSFKQPWAWLVAQGYKDVDNRPWRTAFRGPFLVHASRTFDPAGLAFVRQTFPDIRLPSMSEFEMGGIVGSAEIVDCITESASPWFFGPFGFVLRNAQPLPFRPLKGKLGFFEVPLGVLGAEVCPTEVG